MDFTVEGILARMKSALKNEDTKMEGSFSMDNLQAVAEELARFYAMGIVALMTELTEREENMATSGNESHYIQWAKEAKDSDGNLIVGNAKVDSPRNGTGFVAVVILTIDAKTPTKEQIQQVQSYIDSVRPVGAIPVVSAAESVPVVISCDIKKVSAYTTETVQSQIKKAVEDYFKQIAFQSGVASLNYYKIISIISSVDGVKEVENLTVNGEQNSITIEYNKYFALEGMIINVIE